MWLHNPNVCFSPSKPRKLLAFVYSFPSLIICTINVWKRSDLQQRPPFAVLHLVQGPV
ncbi:hypothetical protein BDV28DRAFT_131743 [Aspergillus coremiiformis]|uniref:Uncharacterized protein n=1 Tax=Aspergillus coremiiformis TaxID=138285 RepID=A0A5N6ZDF3_9EURO|nr:hypothetical protein BDV28DRAFT_131743 [Aspergillus coremiiformis]